MHNQLRNNPIRTSVILLFLFIGLSAYATISLLHYEKSRDRKDWEIFLETTANAKARTVSNWLNSQLSVVVNLADNASLLHYTIESRNPEVSTDVQQAQLTFLRNLLNNTADKNDFSHQSMTPVIKANVRSKSTKGLAVIGHDFEFLIGTPGFQFNPAPLKNSVKNMDTFNRALITLTSSDDGADPMVVFVAPLISQKTTQSDSGKTLGLLYGYKTLEPVINELRVNSSNNSSEETFLVFSQAQQVNNITPLADGTPPLQMNRSLDAPTASAFALKHPGKFGQGLDYRGNDVFFVSTPINGTSWVLIEKIDVHQALTESRQHQRFLVTSLGLASLLIATLLATSWWYVNSLKKQAIAKELRKQNSLLATKTHLLDSINDTIQDLLLLIDANKRHCLFISTLFARKLNSHPSDLIGRPIQSFLGIDTVTLFEVYLTQALGEKQPTVGTLTFMVGTSKSHFHATFAPLHFNEVVGDYDAVLITLHDLTDIKAAEEQRKTLHRQLIKSLMTAIDRHDPYSANHSARTSTIATQVATALAFSPEEIETVTTAATLCNLGKLAIASQILTKTDPLTDEELCAIRLEARHTFDLLKDLDFAGPVQETIAQKNECLDGSGYPNGLHGTAIIPTARVLAVVNAFVAMVSPRAYRDRLSPQDALKQLMAEADTKYDRKVLAALFQVIENQLDSSSWNS